MGEILQTASHPLPPCSPPPTSPCKHEDFLESLWRAALVASRSETPGLACLMFSIPKRLPHPLPQPGARSCGSERQESNPLSWPGFATLGRREDWDRDALSRKEGEPGLPPPRNRDTSGYSWSPSRPRRREGTGNASAARTQALGPGPARWEVTRGPRSEIRARPEPTPGETLPNSWRRGGPACSSSKGSEAALLPTA